MLDHGVGAVIVDRLEVLGFQHIGHNSFVRVRQVKPHGRRVGSDYPVLNAESLVGADLLGKLGMNVELQSMDWGTMIQQNQLDLAVQPWGAAAPIIAIALLTMGTGLIGDGIARTAAGIDRARGEE